MSFRSNKGQANFFVSLLINLNKIAPQNCLQGITCSPLQPYMPVQEVNKILLPCWVALCMNITSRVGSVPLSVVLCRMTLVWGPVSLFLCSGGALFNYFRKCQSQSAHVVSFLVKGYYFLCSVCVVAEGLGRLGEKVDGGQPGLLEGLLVFLRDRGNSLHPWQTFVIDSL